ncbi:MAG: type II secretion system protein GspE, partial [Clostridia bacterium]|nr:type II secretion system protein GspE [Clostridia bacterium]
MTDLPLGEKLVKDGIITRENLDAALASQKTEKNKRIGNILVEMGFLTEAVLLKELSARLNTPLVDLDNYEVDINAVAKIPKKLAQQYNLIAIGLENDTLILVVNDPLDLYALEDIKLITNMP